MISTTLAHCSPLDVDMGSSIVTTSVILVHHLPMSGTASPTLEAATSAPMRATNASLEIVSSSRRMAPWMRPSPRSAEEKSGDEKRGVDLVHSCRPKRMPIHLPR